jgi:hypothetical protein
MRTLLRVLLYAWASPATLLGLLPLPIVWLQGGRAKVVRGAIEIHGGVVTRFLRHGLPWFGGGAAAMTLGHAIWGCDEFCLGNCRDHEHVHVRQYERWGPLFIPAYLIASLIAWWQGLDPYLDNPFEREAYGETGKMTNSE